MQNGVSDLSSEFFEADQQREQVGSLETIKSFKMQLFNPAFRHLYYLTGLAMVGLVVLGYAYEKLSGNTSGLAILGFTASIIHASAWWFTMGPMSPLKKFFACLLVFFAALLCAYSGRIAFQLIADQPLEPVLENLKFISSVIPAWWLSIVILNSVLKESLRWRLNFADSQISPRTSISDLFQMTAIIGAVLAFSSPALLSLVDTDYATILIISLLLNLIVLIPFSLISLKAEKVSSAWSFLNLVPITVLVVLISLALSKLFTEQIEGVADVAIGLVSLTAPYLLMLSMARDNEINLTSGWFDQD